MAYRFATPPSISYYSDSSFNSFDESPGSVNTLNTTPPASPIPQHGPLLLPKIRAQDQIIEPSAGPVGHRRTQSAAAPGSYRVSYNPYLQRLAAPRATTPPDNDLLSPVSVASYDAAFASALSTPATLGDSRRQSVTHVRPSPSRGHSRSSSRESGIGENVLRRHGFPYRTSPAYITAPSVPSQASIMPVSYSQASYVASVTAPAVQAPQYQMPQYSQYGSAAFDFAEPERTTTLLEYLTAPNPTLGLVNSIVRPGRGQLPYFWWDIRNVRPWDDFNVRSIQSIQNLFNLLTIDVSENYLQTPAPVNGRPSSEYSLYQICSSHYATKTNAALAVALGSSHHIAMRGVKNKVATHQKPDFVASYQSDIEMTVSGDGRGRVVGIVRSYEQWNSGMGRSDRIKQVEYLQGLAALHHAMREHGCRYGFIMTEIELVCVRCGGPNTGMSANTTTSSVNPDADGGVPLFGYLELSAPIRLSTYGYDAEGQPLMTANLALWYLHMLAKESPLPGQPTWRMDVGAPAARTRSHCVQRDSWMFKIGDREKRDAKSVRGWVWPEDASSRKEFGKRRRRT